MQPACTGSAAVHTVASGMATCAEAPLCTAAVERRAAPLREAGPVPPIAEAGDLGLYARKFCGAGQGVRALVAEPRASGMARAVDLPVPDTV